MGSISRVQVSSSQNRLLLTVGLLLTVCPRPGSAGSALADSTHAHCCLPLPNQIFGEDFCANNAHRTINIHHSFLPAFEGGRPYHRAHERGVKIIGATAHYATSELDAGVCRQRRGVGESAGFVSSCLERSLQLAAWCRLSPSSSATSSLTRPCSHSHTCMYLHSCCQ